jgi:hypothetical protein
VQKAACSCRVLQTRLLQYVHGNLPDAGTLSFPVCPRRTFLLMCLRAVRDRYAPDCAATMRCSSSCPSLRPTYSLVPSADSASAEMVELRDCTHRGAGCQRGHWCQAGHSLEGAQADRPVCTAPAGIGAWLPHPVFVHWPQPEGRALPGRAAGKGGTIHDRCPTAGPQPYSGNVAPRHAAVCRSACGCAAGHCHAPLSCRAFQKQR